MSHDFKKIKLFNTPIEVGLRALVVLKQFQPQQLELQKIVYLDYLLVNSGDISGGPESIHAKVPFRSSAISVRRKDLSDGLELLVCRDLVAKHFDPDNGVLYSATDLAGPFLKFFESKYFLDLSSRAVWIKEILGRLSTSDINDFLNQNLGNWMSEFSKESLTRQDWHVSDGY